jgi:hypothetical protein
VRGGGLDVVHAPAELVDIAEEERRVSVCWVKKQKLVEVSSEEHNELFDCWQPDHLEWLLQSRAVVLETGWIKLRHAWCERRENEMVAVVVVVEKVVAVVLEVAVVKKAALELVVEMTNGYCWDIHDVSVVKWLQWQ